MKAMLLAAGKGTRLKPLTDRHPKCLVTAAGMTLLEHNIRRLKMNGVTSIIINVHYLGQQIVNFIHEHDFGLEVSISTEEELLETGGGLLKVADFFQEEEAFLVCNSDIYSDLDLRALTISHLENENLVTLAVANRETSRYLRFNEQHVLCGWENQKTGEEISWNNESFHTLAFNGIQVLSPDIFEYLAGMGSAFSSIPVYLKAARNGERVVGYPMDESYWIDIGTVEKLEELRSYLKEPSTGV